MAYDLTALRAELVARGFDYLAQARQDRFLNAAMHAVDETEAWTYLNASTTGTSPLTIADLGRIESVSDVSNLNTLSFLDRRDVVTDYSDLTATGGLPSYYYITGGNTLTTWPVTTVTLTVKYWRTAPDLASGSDQPLMPDRFRDAIVEYAVGKALRDVSNFSEAQAADAAGDVIVARMREWDLLQQGAPNAQIIYNGADW